MSKVKWRTTKLPVDYFNRISDYISLTKRNVSTSDFIRDAIDEKLRKEQFDASFLPMKDVIFNESKIKDIHERIARDSHVEPGMLRESTRRVIEESLDLDLFKFLSKFLKNFAKAHPFNDGNKRTALVAVDSFLRLNNRRLRLKASEHQVTEDEEFFLQNSNQQKTLEEIEEFLSNRVTPYKTSYDADFEIQNSIRENRLMLEKLSQ